MAPRISPASSPRGLSSVTVTTSACFAAALPMSGRLPRSLSPPQPNTTLQPGLRHGGEWRSARSQAHPAYVRNRRRSARRTPKPPRVEPAGGAFQMFQCREHRCRRVAEADGETGRNQGVRRLETARERKRDRMAPPVILDRKCLSVGAWRACEELQCFAAFAHREKTQAPHSRRLCANRSPMGCIGVDDGDTAGADELREQAKLYGEVCLEIGVGNSR